VLVDRIWPRGLAKARAGIDEWARTVAPSTELRRCTDTTRPGSRSSAAASADTLAEPGQGVGDGGQVAAAVHEGYGRRRCPWSRCAAGCVVAPLVRGEEPVVHRGMPRLLLETQGRPQLWPAAGLFLHVNARINKSRLPTDCGTRVVRSASTCSRSIRPPVKVLD
jgi:Protein of unknown function, DUF488